MGRGGTGFHSDEGFPCGVEGGGGGSAEGRWVVEGAVEEEGSVGEDGWECGG